jgi:hypothetical protein
VDIKSVSAQTLHEICRTLKSRRANDGYSYRTHHAGRNDLSDPSTWNLPVYHGSTWVATECIIQYLHTFPHYRDVLSQFGIDDQSMLKEGAT